MDQVDQLQDNETVLSLIKGWASFWSGGNLDQFLVKGLVGFTGPTVRSTASRKIEWIDRKEARCLNVTVIVLSKWYGL